MAPWIQLDGRYGMVRILTEAEKEGQLNSGIENWGIREFWNWGIANYGILGLRIMELRIDESQNPSIPAFQNPSIPESLSESFF